MYGQKALFVAKVRKKIQLFSHLEENLLERTHFEVLMCKTLPAIPSESRGVLLLVIPNPDIMSGNTKGVPGDMEPAVACQ